MASKAPIRLLNRQPAPSSAFRAASSSCSHQPSTRRQFSQTSRSYQSAERSQEVESDFGSRPRWSYTPRAMQAPLRTRPENENTHFEVNEDPRKLDDFYTRMLGNGGDKLLTDETKWLAVTHKSFDQGRRGFNDRLAFLGKRIVDLQTSLALLSAPRQERSTFSKGYKPDRYGRVPFRHPSLEGLENLTGGTKGHALDIGRISRLAKRYGVPGVVRWKPRLVNELSESGEDTVLNGTLYAIIGALALERGGEQAIKTTREKLLSPLGLIS